MNKKHLESRIYFTEKDIYDALMSSKRSMTIPLIIDLARDRGILLSPEDSRDDLIKYLSSLVYDYYDLNVLIDHITPSHKKEKSKVTKIDSKIDVNNIKTISKEVAGEDLTIQVNLDPKNPKKTTLKVEYYEIDLSKTRLRQKVRKESVIEITEEDTGTTISKPSNDRVDQIMQKLLEGIEKKSNSKLNEKKINLYGLQYQKKIEYFTTLIKSIEGCILSDVIKVSVNHEEDNPEAEEDVYNLITNASFKGKGLLSTPEYQKLKSNGYYITSIIWRAEESKKNGDIIEFESTLSSSKECEEVSFSAKGAYRFIEKDKYTNTRRPLSEEEVGRFTKFLEEAAFKVYDEILTDED